MKISFQKLWFKHGNLAGGDDYLDKASGGCHSLALLPESVYYKLSRSARRGAKSLLSDSC